MRCGRVRTCRRRAAARAKCTSSTMPATAPSCSGTTPISPALWWTGSIGRCYDPLLGVLLGSAGFYLVLQGSVLQGSVLQGSVLQGSVLQVQFYRVQFYRFSSTGFSSTG